MQLDLIQSTIRSYLPQDASQIARHLDDDSITRHLNPLPRPYTVAHAAEWIERATGSNPETCFAIVVNGEAVGGIGIKLSDIPVSQGFRSAQSCAPSHHSAEIGYWLTASLWGRGIMTEAVAALSDWAFAHLSVVRLHAIVYTCNPASARVLAKAGFEFEGRLRAHYFRDDEYIDGLLYARVQLPTVASTVTR